MFSKNKLLLVDLKEDGIFQEGTLNLMKLQKNAVNVKRWKKVM
ncbi:NUDIX hydrolase [Bacillus pseudomycoides]|nr:NUDIX hydrolase [Bacillus pseudomycoides]